MLGAAIIVFRETLEAALIVGILAAATRGIDGRMRWLAAGICAGVVGSLLIAAATDRIAQWAEGAGPELFNAAALGIAVLMLAWHNIWMAGHGAQMAREAKQVGQAVRSGDKTLLAVWLVVAVAVLREGSETVLFLHGVLAAAQGGPSTVATGAALGLAAGAGAGLALYLGIVRIPARWLFTATSGLILLLAAAMASQMARFLVQADLLPSLVSPAWDTSELLSTESAVGTLLHLLVGYEARPSGLQILFYVTVLVLILLGMRWSQRPTVPRPS